MHTEVAIIGAGVSGIGLGIIFEKYKIKDYTLFEMGNSVGSSFTKWTQETEFISPSFVSEDFGLHDINAVSFEPDDSPGRFLKKERFTGKEYQKYLEHLATTHNLNIQFDTKITNITKENETFLLKTEKGENIKAKIVIYAGGEYNTPFIPDIKGKEYGIHNSKITSYKDLEKDEVVIIGGYESGIDVAYNAIKNGKKVILLEKENSLSYESPDPSLSISLHSQKRLSEIQNNPNFEIITDFEVSKIEKIDGNYHIFSEKGGKVSTNGDIVFATGFDFSQGIMKEMFEFEDGRPKLTKDFESTKTESLFIVGPMVKIGAILFCFIYKYKLLFPTIVFHSIKKLGLDTKQIEREFQIFGQTTKIQGGGCC